MSDTNMVTGHVTPTTPGSSPLDTLKALVLRSIDHLEYVIDRLGGGVEEIPEDVFEFLDFIKLNQYKAIAEHLPVSEDERLGELRHLHPDAYLYEDGSPVVEKFEAKYGASVYYPRYDGPREEALQRHEDWSRQQLERVDGHERFDNIIRGIEWGSSGPPQC